ncbi:type I restriction-modification system subunit M [Acidimicrobiia bacterium EGI L10123]|uniref:type I restriction-modification system subunit M n=1 Tax=Salinilacustrithrix flava TaxID=2957203 RepID=UPI003D7C162C|nr:type I restriction-modification system subunit M [Acidimicrobiia bacterium EGI L10123]
MTQTYSHTEAVRTIWAAADVLRGSYKAHDYGKVILPLVVLRRLDAALLDSKQAVLDAAEKAKKAGLDDPHPLLTRASGRSFYCTSPLTFATVIADESYVAENLRSYILGFSTNVQDIMDKFGFDAQIDKLAERNLLTQVMSAFVDIDLHPDRVTNSDMGSVFEELIRRFSEQSNETAGEHFTPREVVGLMVDLLFVNDGDTLTEPGKVISVYDPTAGTGGMLSVADERVTAMNARATVVPYGQELNDESYAICKADMLLKGADRAEIAFGNSLTEDAFTGRTFDYTIANPPYGVDWKGYATKIKAEQAELGDRGRFGPGLPSTADGQMVFLLHMLSKLQPYDPAKGQQGGRMAVVFNGSPLFSGAPGGGESEIRRHIIENDLLEAIIGLPEAMFFNTSILTYIWILTNRKAPDRQGKVQLIDARDLFQRMRKPLGEKRNELAQRHIDEIVRLYGDMVTCDRSTILPNEAFGFRRITIERPKRARYAPGAGAVGRLRDHPDWNAENVRKADAERADDVLAAVEKTVEQLPAAGTLSDALKSLGEDGDFNALLKKAKNAVAAALSVPDPSADLLIDGKGNLVADPELSGIETVPLPAGFDPTDATVDPTRVGVDNYVAAEVHPHAQDSWVDHDKTKVGYEIPFTRIFYRYDPPRPLGEIDADIKAVEAEILALLTEVTE